MSKTPNCNIPIVIKCPCNLLQNEIAIFSHQFFITASTDLKQNGYAGKEVPVSGS